MKKKTGVLITIVIVVVAVCGSFGLNYLKGLRRYDSIEESLNDYDRKEFIRVVDAVYEDNLAYVYYQTEENSYSTSLILKDDRGWLPPEDSLLNLRKRTMVDDGFVRVVNVSGRFIVRCNLVYDSGDSIPEIRHSSSKTLQQKICTVEDVEERVCLAVCSFDGALPENYRIWIGDEEVVLSE